MNQSNTPFEADSLDVLFQAVNKKDKDTNTQRNPFKFLDPYTLEDRDLFFGRDSEIAELYSKFYSSRLLLVYGESGSGKTSLIQCGLQAEIPKEEALFIPVRSAFGIVDTLKTELLKLLKKDNNEVEPSNDLSDDLSELIEQTYEQKSKTLVLVFDQFEEFFLSTPQSKRQRLAQQIAHWLKEKPYLRIIFSIREEYYARLTELESQLPELFTNRLWVRRMTREQTREVITQPCKLCNIEIETELTDKLLNDLSADGKETDLPTLQVVLDSLYNQAKTTNPDKPKLTLKDYETLGKIDNILAEFIENRIGKHDNSEALRQVLKAMITAQGTRKISKLEDIQQRLGSFGEKRETEELSQILQQLSNERIIREDVDNGLYELRHDSLANAISKWMTSDEKELVELRQMLENRYQEYQQRGTLLNHETLQLIIPYKTKLNVNKEIADFIEKSQKINKKKRQRVFLGLALVLFSVFAAISFAWWQAEKQKVIAIEKTIEAEKQRNLAEEQTQLAKRQTVVVEEQKTLIKKQVLDLNTNLARAYESKLVLALAKGDISEKEGDKSLLEYKKAWLYALEAKKLNVKKNSAILKQDSIVKTTTLSIDAMLSEQKRMPSFPIITDIIDSAVSDNGQFLATATGPESGGQPFGINIWNINTGKMLHTLMGHQDISKLFFNKNANHLLSVSADYTIRLWDVKTGQLIHLFRTATNKESAIFSPNGLDVAFTDRNSVKVYNIETESINHIQLSEPTLDVAYNQTSNMLTILTPSKVYLWDSKTGKILKSIKIKAQKISYTNDGNLLVINKNIISILNTRSGLVTHQFKEEFKKSLLNHDGSVIAFYINNKINLRSTSTGKSIFSKELSPEIRKKSDFGYAGIRNISFSPDGKFIAVTRLNKVYLWNIKTSNKRILHSQKLSSSFIILSLTNDKVFAGYRQIVAWDIETGNILQKKHKDSFNRKKINSIFDGKIIFANSSTIWDTRQKLSEYIKYWNWDPDQKIIVGPNIHTLSYGDGVVNLWNIKTDKLVTFVGHSDMVHSIAISPDETTLASGSRDNTLRFWDIETGDLRRTIEFKGRVLSIAYIAKTNDSPSLTVSTDYTTHLLEERLSKSKYILSKKTDKVIFSIDSKLFATLKNNKIQIFDSKTGELKKVLLEHAKLRSLVFSPDNEHILVTYYDGTSIWNIETGKPVQSFEAIDSVVYSSNGRLLATASDKNVILRDATGRVINSFDHDYSVKKVIISPNSQILVSGSGIFDEGIKVWNIQAGQEIFTIKKRNIDEIQFAPTGALILKGSDSIEIWDVNEKKLKQRFNHSDYLESFVISSDEKQLATGTNGGVVSLWDIKSGFLLYKFKGHSGSINGLAFSPDGSRLLSASEDKTIREWDLKLVKLNKIYNAHLTGVRSVFYGDGDSFYSISNEGVVRLWNESQQLTLRIFNDFNPEQVSEALQFLWELGLDKETFEFVHKPRTPSLYPNKKGYYYSEDKFNDLLDMPREDESKMDQLVRWLESRCAYKDKNRKKTCENSLKTVH